MNRHAFWLVALFVATSALVLTAPAGAHELDSEIAAAQSRAAAAAAEADELRAKVTPAASRFEAQVRRATPVRSMLRSARRRVAHIEAAQHSRHLAALAAVARTQAANRKAAEEHDDKVTSDIGLGIAALLLAAIALAWGWFRASAAVAALTRLTLAQAIGLCVGGGFLTVLIGAALQDAAGILAALGSALVGLGVGLAAAFLLARHSAEVQRARSKPVLGRERLPTRLTQVLAGILAVLCVILFATALSAPAAKSSAVSIDLRSLARSAEERSPMLVEARAQVKRLEEKAARVLAVLARDKAQLRKARRSLGHVHTRMVRAEDQAEDLSRRLASLEARERRELQAEERQARKALEAEEREFAEAAEEEAEAAEELAAGQCDPNYSGCLDPSSPDYDCEGGSGDGPDYTGTVEVLGVDHYGLDADGDGIGCDS